VTSAENVSLRKSPRIPEAGTVICGLLTGFLTPLILNYIDSLYLPFRGGNVMVLASGAVPYGVLIAVIARIVAEASWPRAALLGLATLVSASVAITLSANTNATLDMIAEPGRELIGGPVGGVIGSGVMAIAALLLRIGPARPRRWLPMVFVGTVLGALLAVDVWLGSENVWVLFPIWQASIALILMRTLQDARN
jgi:hypothetical protein